MEDDSHDRENTRSHTCLGLSGKIIHTSASSLTRTESSHANIDFSLPSSLNSKSSFSLDDTIEEEEDYFDTEARPASLTVQSPISGVHEVIKNSCFIIIETVVQNCRYNIYNN